MSPTAERLVVGVLSALLILARSGVFVWYEQAAFDSDQAIVGLMAKHLAEGRAFPLFYYGQSYLLAVQAWLAAPLFLLVGPSVVALKLPLVAINVAVALVLMRLLERETGLRPALAGVASICFIAAAPGISAQLVSTLGVSVEPFLYVLLLWALRERPILQGLVLGVGFLHREFTAYGLVALIVVGLVDRSILKMRRARGVAVAVLVAVAVWFGAMALRPLSSAAGPGTSFNLLVGTDNNLESIANRVCREPLAILSGMRTLVGSFLGLPLGLTPVDLSAYGIATRVRSGAAGLWPVFGILLAVALSRIVWLGWKRRGEGAARALAFPAYLFVTGALAAVAYDVGRCGALHIFTLRYALLTLLMPIGIAAAYLRVEPRRPLRGVAVTVLAAWALFSAHGHARLINEYVRHTPPSYRRIVADYLVSHQVKYARAEYWTSYAVTFLANERVIVAMDEGVSRIHAYQLLVAAHESEAVTVSRRPCAQTPSVEIYRGVYWLCGPLP